MLNLILIVLLPKAEGGRRPIGLFPSPTRLWMRARTIVARRWEAAHARPCIYAGAGMGAQRAAWQASFHAEVASLAKFCYGQALLDLVKAFERIPHWAIIKAAKKHGFCGWVLRLSLAAYRAKRTIAVAGVFSRVIVAVRGITAGSGFATSELRVILLDVVDSTYVLWKRVTLALYVDDFTLDTKGTAQQVRDNLAGATNHIIWYLEKIFGLEISAKKCVMLANRPKVARETAKKVKDAKVKKVSSAKLLGAPSAGGARRSTKVLKDRLKNFREKLKRLHALRRSGVRTQVMARAAGTPAMTYSVECMGMSDSHLDEARSIQARAAAPEGGGKAVDLVLWITDGTSGSSDPAFPAHVDPIVKWATAWWEGWQPGPTMVDAFTDANTKLNSCVSSMWHKVAGPVTALIASALRIGWFFEGPSMTTNDLGVSFDF